MLRLQIAASPHIGVRRQLAEADRRVLTIAKVHERLYQQTEVVDRIEIGQYFRNLCQSFERTLVDPSQPVSLRVDADHEEMPMDQAVHLVLIVNEWVTNSLKYAFRDGTGGAIAVTFRTDAESQSSLVVADNGQGLPPGFDAAESINLSLKLLRALVDALQGLSITHIPPPLSW